MGWGGGVGCVSWPVWAGLGFVRRNVWAGVCVSLCLSVGVCVCLCVCVSVCVCASLQSVISHVQGPPHVASHPLPLPIFLRLKKSEWWWWMDGMGWGWGWGGGGWMDSGCVPVCSVALWLCGSVALRPGGG